MKKSKAANIYNSKLNTYILITLDMLSCISLKSPKIYDTNHELNALQRNTE